MSGSSLPESLRSFVEGALGDSLEARETSWPHGEARVWALASAGRIVAYLKQHRQPRKFDVELRAYRECTAALGEFAPRLLGVHADEPAALLLSALPGAVVADAEWPGDVEYRLHVRAGRLLRRLHSVPVDEATRAELERQTRASLDHWMNRSRAHFPEAVIDWARSEVEAGIADAPPICVCHRDFGPRNWVALGGAELGVIDFERTCLDFQCIDWSRLWTREWQQRPALKDAFFEGYGAIAYDWERPMRRLLALPAVGGVAWAMDHGDTRFAEENRLLVERLRHLSMEG